jgi:hypothetical protein
MDYLSAPPQKRHGETFSRKAETFSNAARARRRLRRSHQAVFVVEGESRVERAQH